VTIPAIDLCIGPFPDGLKVLAKQLFSGRQRFEIELSGSHREFVDADGQCYEKVPCQTIPFLIVENKSAAIEVLDGYCETVKSEIL
jgi:hypothetical protein